MHADPAYQACANSYLRRKRTARGRADAKAKGVKFGRKPKLTTHQQREAQKRIAAGKTRRSVARNYNVA